MLNIEAAKLRTITADRNQLIITEMSQRFDRVFKTSGESASDLAMNLRTGKNFTSRGSEKMNIDRCRKFGVECGKMQERLRGQGEGALRQIDMRFLGENKEGASSHTFAYETAR